MFKQFYKDIDTLHQLVDPFKWNYILELGKQLAILRKKLYG